MENTAAESNIQALNARIQQESAFVDMLHLELGKVIVGQRFMLDRLLIALLGNGHILLEGVPGLAKTLAIKSLASAIDATYSRIQFTPDLLPTDLLGTQIYNMHKGEFHVKKGPIFANFVLADEINRAPAKVQSALLESMQERQVTLGEETFLLPKPFLVLATQNPVEQEGTYPLPEAQMDRFMLKTVITYPKIDEEREILRMHMRDDVPVIKPVVNLNQIVEARRLIDGIYMDAKIEQYILDLVFATRKPEDYRIARLKPLIQFGASPRASIQMARASRVHAFIQHRAFVVPEDVRAVALDVLRHRIGLTYEAEAENLKTEDIVTEILNAVEVP